MPNSPILIVDDEPGNLATLKQILGNDYALVFARNGQECLNATKKHKPALILLDIQMPDMDGYTVCKILKADTATESIPVIFVSSLSEIGDETAGFDCGGVDYIIKPVSSALVRARVRTHVSLVRATLLERYVKQLEIEQAKTARLSRIHAVLSGTNSAIVRIREPQALLEEACHIAVEQGGFGIAWIGIVNDLDNSFKLTASQGVNLEQMSASLFPETGGIATEPDIPEQVLKTGQATYCNDVRIKAHVDRSCRDALDRGYLSIVGLPLIANDKLVGVMVLYARESNYFDDEEMKLLSELAGDMSFALLAINNEKRANFLSYFDALTALPNTSLFLDRTDQLIQAAYRENYGVFVIAINLDRFKHLNDTLGRHIGDHILKLVAKRLVDGLPGHYSVARIGADNFAILGELASNADVSATCEQVISLLQEPMLIDAARTQVLARMGVAIYPNDANSAESLFKNAEAALKQCKLQKKRFQFFSWEINARISDMIEMENMLKTGLDQNQFVLHFQPKIDLRTGQIIGCEALIRWQHPERGLLPPAAFIALAEETGLIVPIGTWVIHAVCAQQSAWLRDGLHIVPVAVNLSALQFKEGNVLEIVGEALSKNNLGPESIELELTESTVMQKPEDAEVIMHAFRAHGLSLSLDDFGTGYSSLAYLKRFPFNTVKIDKAFVTDITQNPEDAAIATAIIGMAHSLHMSVIAEGVETEAQLKFLRARNCDQIQGYFFSPPVPAIDFATMLFDDKQLAPEVDIEQQTLLLVDSEEAILAALRRSLRGQGYRILTAPDSQKALELLAINPVQVILCEQRLSKMTGSDFLTVAAKLYPDTMRIVLSGYTELQSVLDVINRGEIYRFLTKPWDDELLRQNISEAFRRYRPSVNQ
ncbi:EAL domain-containing protein [Undibacterium sp. Di26W]|uniref:EAL domain-containing protein n=1 Tax=Undibacterium sp. Di26W TaxID=3413035 RepID=UPI003BF30452